MESAVSRRFRTVPVVVVLWVLILVLVPVLIPLALLVDIVRWAFRRTPFTAVRLTVFLLAYLTIEVIGLVALGIGWATSLPRHDRAEVERKTLAVQRRWAEAVLVSVRSVFGLTFHVEGLEHVEKGPMLIFARHASIVDNLLPAHYITRPNGVRIGYVMKSELLLDPCLDIAGNRLPNVFVRRGAGESEHDIAAIRHLAEGLGPDQAVLIYPEGTRFSAAKLAASIDRLGRSAPRLHEIACGLRSVLPPRPSGALALLEACDADVVVMAHRGLDGFARVADIWKGAMVRTHVDIAFWRIPRADIPVGRKERIEWLFGVWRHLDAWVSGESQAKT